MGRPRLKAEATASSGLRRSVVSSLMDAADRLAKVAGEIDMGWQRHDPQDNLDRWAKTLVELQCAKQDYEFMRNEALAANKR